MSALWRALKRVVAPAARSSAQYGDKELGVLKAKAAETLKNMLELKEQRAQRREMMEKLVMETLRTTLLSLEAVEAGTRMKPQLTAAEKESIRGVLGKVDTLMDQKSKEALEDMDVHMEKLLQIRNSPPEMRDAMLTDMSKSIAQQATAAQEAAELEPKS